MENEIRVLIADDHPLLRQGLRHTIESDGGIKIVAEAGDGLEALAKIRECRPQIAILDVDMPQLDGFQVALAVREEHLNAGIIFLTVHREESFMKKALGLGAAGYVLKDSAVTDIAAAVRAVSQNQSFISPAMLGYLVKNQAAKPVDGLASLTPAERTVLKQIAEYKTTKEIAEALFVSPRTIESHRLNICQKLHLKGSHSLIKYALEHGGE